MEAPLSSRHKGSWHLMPRDSLRMKVYQGHPLTKPMTLIHGQTTRNPIRRGHVARSYKEGMAFN
jgi:hypothetical protein